MRITLMHNPKAGAGNPDKKELMAALGAAGHQVIYQSTKKRNYKKALKQPTDLVLVAGGDGTIAKVAARLIDTAIPLSVLPLGTANNLARSLGFNASAEQIISRLDRGRKHAFDIGIARGPWGKRYIFEGAGAGLLADYVEKADRDPKRRAKTRSKQDQLAHHVSAVRTMLRDYSARKWKIWIDGEKISARYILWEAMNIRSVGPALYLAPRAAIKDGRFDFVSVRENERTVLAKHLEARLAGKKTKFPLPFRRFSRLEVISQKSPIHFDDELWPGKKDKPKKGCEIEITVKPAALLILQPGK